MCILQCIDKLSVQLGLCAVQITESYKYGKYPSTWNGVYWHLVIQ